MKVIKLQKKINFTNPARKLFPQTLSKEGFDMLFYIKCYLTIPNMNSWQFLPGLLIFFNYSPRLTGDFTTTPNH